MGRVAVTGATGFLGNVTCRRLRERHEVVALGRNREAGERLSRLGCLFRPCDLRSAEGVLEALRGVDWVVHCAARSSAWGPLHEFELDNVLATQNVVQACIANHVARLVHISSPSIYSRLGPSLNVKESDPLPPTPLNHYAATKLRAEEVVDAAVKHSNIEAITLRPQAIFGPDDPSIMPRFIEMNRDRGIPCFDGRSPVVDVTVVDNVAQAIELSLNAPASAIGQHFNISNGEPVELLAFLQTLFGELGMELRTRRIPYPVARVLASAMEQVYSLIPSLGEPPLTRYKLAVIAHSRTLDISLARRELGYQPEVSLTEGVRRFVLWWKERNT